jgi:N-hydroxyarylamine O-acetyltransferase
MTKAIRPAGSGSPTPAQTSPLSHFTRSTICSRLTPGSRVSISGRMLIQTQGGTRAEQ